MSNTHNEKTLFEKWKERRRQRQEERAGISGGKVALAGTVATAAILTASALSNDASAQNNNVSSADKHVNPTEIQINTTKGVEAQIDSYVNGGQYLQYEDMKSLIQYGIEHNNLKAEYSDYYSLEIPDGGNVAQAQEETGEKYLGNITFVEINKDNPGVFASLGENWNASIVNYDNGDVSLSVERNSPEKGVEMTSWEKGKMTSKTINGEDISVKDVYYVGGAEKNPDHILMHGDIANARVVVSGDNEYMQQYNDLGEPVSMTECSGNKSEIHYPEGRTLNNHRKNTHIEYIGNEDNIRLQREYDNEGKVTKAREYNEDGKLVEMRFLKGYDVDYSVKFQYYSKGRLAGELKTATWTNSDTLYLAVNMHPNYALSPEQYTTLTPSEVEACNKNPREMNAKIKEKEEQKQKAPNFRTYKVNNSTIGVDFTR